MLTGTEIVIDGGNVLVRRILGKNVYRDLFGFSEGVFNVTQNHNVLTQVFKDSMRIWMKVRYCCEPLTK